MARGACFADYENNGKVDAFVNNLGAQGTLLHNVSTGTGHWIEIKLWAQRAIAMASARGLKFCAAASDGLQSASPARGYLSQDDGRLHFGLGRRRRSTKFTVHWPSGREQTLEKQAATASSPWRSQSDERTRSQAGCPRLHQDLDAFAQVLSLLLAFVCGQSGCCLNRPCRPANRTKRLRSMPRRWKCCISPDGARLYVLCQDSRRGSRARCSKLHSHQIDLGGPSRAVSLFPRRSRAIRHQLLGRHALGHRHARSRQ